MKKIKIFFALILSLLLLASPMLDIYAVTSNIEQIISQGGETSGDGVKISKTISESSLENYFDITLKVQTQEEAKSQDIAVVLVMDVSNTMIQNYLSAGNEPKTRLKAALDASTEFLKSFGKNSDGINAKRKIGFVAFNSNGHILQTMTDCKTEATGMSIAADVLNKTKQITKEIEKPDPDGYGKDPTRFTNIQAGLQLANDLLYNNSEIKNIQNKYIIFLSDGYPTTYSIKGTYIGHNTIYPDSKYLHDDITNRPFIYGTNYSDRSAEAAEKIAKTLRNKGVTIYSIGTGIDNNFQTIPEYEAKMTSSFSTIDRYDYNYKVGIPSTASTPQKRKQEDLQSFRQWLGGKDSTTTAKIGDGIGSGYGSGHYFDVAKDIYEMQKAFTDIFEDIKYLSEASWVAEDPMNSDTSSVRDVINFVGIYDNNKNLSDSVSQSATSDNTASYDSTTDKINWDLKKSKYTKAVDGNTTYYNYELKYRIRLKTEANNFESEKIFKTNGKTTLTYIIKESGKDQKLGSLTFKVPEVKGYLGTLTFDKLTNYGRNKPLEGTTFEIYHSSDCPCLKERKHIDENFKMTSTSNSEGKVIFDNIPSGHKYKIHEISTDEYHEINTESFDVTVSYGQTTSPLKDKKIINNYKTKDLTISKTVKGDNSGRSFTFIIEATYKDEKLEGKYKATRINGNKTTNEEVEFIGGKITIKLKDNERFTIEKLPYLINFKITEKDNKGFIVKYKVNDEETIIYNEKDIKSRSLDTNTTVNFTNISSYELPATGSSGMLILLIMGSLLLVIPVIYISVNILNRKLTVKE